MSSDVVYMLDRLSAAESGPKGIVKRMLARRIGIAPGTIENIQRGRLKFVERVEPSIRTAFVRLLESEIARATDELEMVRRRDQDGDSAALRKAEMALRRRMAEAQALIARRCSTAAE